MNTVNFPPTFVMTKSASGGRLAFENTGATPRVLGGRLAIGLTGTTGAASSVPAGGRISGHRHSCGFQRIAFSLSTGLPPVFYARPAACIEILLATIDRRGSEPSDFRPAVRTSAAENNRTNGYEEFKRRIKRRLCCRQRTLPPCRFGRCLLPVGKHAQSRWLETP
jgi:hypothetical protein